MNLRKKMIMMANINQESLCDNYLTIEALEDDLTVSFSVNPLQYSIDDCKTWIELPVGTTTPAINTGEKISFKATGLTPTSSDGIGTFTVNKQFNLSGNCMSMLFGDDGKDSYDLTGYDYAFLKLFYNCTTLVSVSDGFLPATILADSCYRAMFSGCTILTVAPELPAMILAIQCYRFMFQNCSNLITAPELPATILVDSCYYGMFYSCSRLNYIKAMFITTPSSSYTYIWVSNVASTGTFVKNIEATWDVTGSNGVPEKWTITTEANE